MTLIYSALDTLIQLAVSKIEGTTSLRYVSDSSMNKSSLASLTGFKLVNTGVSSISDVLHEVHTCLQYATRNYLSLIMRDEKPLISPLY